MSGPAQPQRGRTERNTSVHFTISVPGSADSSRASSPAQSLRGDSTKISGGASGKTALGKEKSYRGLEDDLLPGRGPQDVYDVTLPRWRAAIRRRLVRTVQVESEIIAKMQVQFFVPQLSFPKPCIFAYLSELEEDSPK